MNGNQELSGSISSQETIGDWSKSIEWGGPEQRAGGSSVFEPLARGESCNSQLPMAGGSFYFLRGIGTHYLPTYR